MSQFAFRTTLAGVSLALLAALSACNGGGGSDTTSTAGVGSGGTGYASGTVTGFGSVVVDGVTIDDRSASVDVEVSPGVSGDSDVLLGQRVEVETDKDGLAKHIHIMAEVMGRCSRSTASISSWWWQGKPFMPIPMPTRAR